MMLKTIENMLGLRDPGNLKKKQLQRQVKGISEQFALLKGAVIIMDEVDIILHPLRSELNCPIGTIQPAADPKLCQCFPEDGLCASH